MRTTHDWIGSRPKAALYLRINSSDGLARLSPIYNRPTCSSGCENNNNINKSDDNNNDNASIDIVNKEGMGLM